MTIQKLHHKTKMVNRYTYHESVMEAHKKKSKILLDKHITYISKPEYNVEYNWISDLINYKSHHIQVSICPYSKTNVTLLIFDDMVIPRVYFDKHIEILRISSPLIYKYFTVKLPKGFGKMTKLSYLHIFRLNIGNAITPVYKLTNLDYLEMPKCSISRISKKISRLNNLQVLDLSENSIKKIPSAIYGLTKLRWLLLHFNKLTVIPKEIFNLTKLNKLKTNCNPLIEIPIELRRMTNLEFN